MTPIDSSTAFAPLRHPERQRARWLRRSFGAGLLLIAALGAGSLRGEVSKEYQLKAAFLYNFTKFVEWPAQRFNEAAAPIVIGVVGTNPFGDELEKIVRGRKVNGRDIVIAQFPSVEEAKVAHAVFVSAGEAKRSRKDLDALLRAGVLVVGDAAESAALGSVITFVMVEDKVRFEINLVSADQAGLTISSQLLKLATQVRRKP